MKTKINLVIVSDHPAIPLGLAEILAAEKDIKISSPLSISEASKQASKIKADVALVDISIQAVSGIDVIGRIGADPKLRVVAINLNGEDTFATRAIKSGAKGYLTKNLDEELALAVRRVFAGSLYVSDSVAQAMVATIARAGQSPVDHPIELLSDREVQLAEQVGKGHTNEEISKIMEIAVRTVETHKQHMRKKLGLATGAQLNRFCVEWYNERHAARKL